MLIIFLIVGPKLSLKTFYLSMNAFKFLFLDQLLGLYDETDTWNMNFLLIN